MKAIRGFKAALEEEEIPEIDTKTVVNSRLSLANIDKDGNSKEGQLPIEKVKDRICTIGEDLKIDSLSRRRRAGVFSMKEPILEEAKKFYKECVQSASLLPEQESFYFFVITFKLVHDEKPFDTVHLLIKATACCSGKPALLQNPCVSLFR